MKKRYLLILLLLIPLVIADPVTIEFNSPDKQDFTNYFLTLKLGSIAEREVLQSSSITLDLEPANYESEAILDDFSTPVPDYFGSQLITIGDDIDYFVFPIGFMQGSVVDTAGNLIPRADLSFNCFSPVQIALPSRSDSTGFFNIPNIPVGSCNVVASTSNLAGSADFVVKQGQASKVEIVLTKELVSSDYKTTMLVVLVLVLGLMLWIFWKKPFLARKVEKKEEIVDLVEEPETGFSKKTLALLEILSSKERTVVDFLLENDNHSSQARIRHGTKIPRTSLARVLHSLEQKKMVQIEKEGKMVSVELTKFFLD